MQNSSDVSTQPEEQLKKDYQEPRVGARSPRSLLNILTFCRSGRRYCKRYGEITQQEIEYIRILQPDIMNAEPGRGFNNIEDDTETT